MNNSPFISKCTAEAIRDAAHALKDGHLVAFPTETVYGLGADARNPEAVKRIYEVKGRPSDHPLIVHISSINQLDKWAGEIPDYAIELARAFWPGPMTLILKRTDIAKNFITGGQDTVGLRVPSDPIALALVQEFEKISDSAIAAPSANRYGHVSPTSLDAVLEELCEFLNNKDMILDGGSSSIGIESSIVDCSHPKPRILRPGAVTMQQIESTIQQIVDRSVGEQENKFSGSPLKHYAPIARVLINVVPKSGNGLIAPYGVETPPGVERLSSPKTSLQFAYELYSSFRKADLLGLKEVVVILPENSGIGVAIIDRITRAANGR